MFQTDSLNHMIENVKVNTDSYGRYSLKFYGRRVLKKQVFSPFCNTFHYRTYWLGNINVALTKSLRSAIGCSYFMSKYSEVKKYLKTNKHVLCSFYGLISHSLFVSKDNIVTVVNGSTAYSRTLDPPKKLF